MFRDTSSFTCAPFLTPLCDSVGGAAGGSIDDGGVESGGGTLGLRFAGIPIGFTTQCPWEFFLLFSDARWISVLPATASGDPKPPSDERESSPSNEIPAAGFTTQCPWEFFLLFSDARWISVLPATASGDPKPQSDERESPPSIFSILSFSFGRIQFPVSSFTKPEEVEGAFTSRNFSMVGGLSSPDFFLKLGDCQ